MKYAYVAPKSSLSPIFGTSNPGLNSSIGRLTNFIGPGEAGRPPVILSHFPESEEQHSNF